MSRCFITTRNKTEVDIGTKNWGHCDKLEMKLIMSPPSIFENVLNCSITGQCHKIHPHGTELEGREARLKSSRREAEVKYYAETMKRGPVRSLS